MGTEFIKWIFLFLYFVFTFTKVFHLDCMYHKFMLDVRKKTGKENNQEQKKAA